MKKETGSIIKLNREHMKLKNYMSLYFSLVKIAAIVMLVFIPLAIALGVYGMITGRIYAILCVLLLSLAGICSLYLIMFNIVFPVRYYKVSKKLDMENSYISVFEDKISFHSVYDLENGKSKNHYEDNNEYAYESFKKIKEKKDRFLFITKKEFGSYAFYLWKDNMDEKSLEIVKSKKTKMNLPIKLK